MSATDHETRLAQACDWLAQQQEAMVACWRRW